MSSYKQSSAKFSAKESAIYLLSRRDHGTFELEQKLLSKGYDRADIDAAVSYCLENHYLDDFRYAKSQTRQHIAKGHGLNRIRQELSMRRVAEATIEAALAEEKVDWFELAKLTAEKKFKGKRAADQKEYAKQVRFMLYRGFDFEQVKYALSGE